MIVKKENGKIYVKSDYNAEFVRRAKNIGGKWGKPYWVFPEENEDVLEKLCVEIYGEYLGGKKLTVIVDIYKSDVHSQGSGLYLGGKLLATRFSRDSEVVVPDDVAVYEGYFEKSGGSSNNPKVTCIEGTKLKVRNFPQALYDRLKSKDGIEIVEDVDRSALEKERDQLLARVKEIENILNNMDL